MSRADPFFERDATGWQFSDVWSGNAAVHYSLPENASRTVAFNPKTKKPEDKTLQPPNNRLLAQNHD